MSRRLMRAPNKGGRPTRKSPELVAEILSAIMRGATFDDAARECGVAASTWGAWRKADPGLDRLAEMARQMGNQLKSLFRPSSLAEFLKARGY